MLAMRIWTDRRVKRERAKRSAAEFEWDMYLSLALELKIRSQGKIARRTAVVCDQ
jgi:hypothetical protein